MLSAASLGRPPACSLWAPSVPPLGLLAITPPPPPFSRPQVALAAARLDRAHKLLGGLGGEKGRWTETVASLNGDYTNLVGEWAAGWGVAFARAPSHATPPLNLQGSPMRIA